MVEVRTTDYEVYAPSELLSGGTTFPDDAGNHDRFAGMSYRVSSVGAAPRGFSSRAIASVSRTVPSQLPVRSSFTGRNDYITDIRQTSLRRGRFDAHWWLSGPVSGRVRVFRTDSTCSAVIARVRAVVPP